MKFLIFGRGILGSALAEELSRRGLPFEVVPHASCDIRDDAKVRAAIERFRPDAIVNAAAFTRVDDAEDEREAAFAVNGTAPGLIARAAREAGAAFVHVSTDFVFSGGSTRPYIESDPPSPLSAYGQSKLQGELEVAREGGDWLCVRTSWHYGPGGPNFVRAIVDKALSGAPLRVVSDQRGRPTYSGHLAAAILALLEGSCRGIYHYADAGELSWFDFAKAIVTTAGLSAPVEPICSSDLARKAPRPAYSVLDTGKFEEATGAACPPWEVGLERYLNHVLVPQTSVSRQVP